MVKVVTTQCNVITIEGLIEQLETFMDCAELTHYRITEELKKQGKCTYEVYNLSGDIESINGSRFVLFDDLEHILKEDYTRVLNMIVAESLLGITHDWNKTWKAKLLFKDGSIEIERIGSVN